MAGEEDPESSCMSMTRRVIGVERDSLYSPDDIQVRQKTDRVVDVNVEGMVEEGKVEEGKE